MQTKQSTYIFTLMGLLLGLLLDCMMRYEIKTAFYYMTPLLTCLFYAVTYNEKHSLRLIITSLSLAVFCSLPLFAFHFELEPNEKHLATFLIAFPMFAYVTHAFHYAYHRDRTWRLSYTHLFEGVWNIIPLLIFAGLFTGLAQTLIYLGAYMFKTVGNTFLWSLFFQHYHGRLISNTTLFFIGLAIGKQNISVIYNLRFLLLRVMYYLFPVLALISVIYFGICLSHLIKHHKLLTDLYLLIPLNTLGIIFFNAYFQDGSSDTSPSIWLRYAFKAYRVILLLQTLAMSWHIFYTNSFDMNLLIYLLTAVFFALTYAFTAFIPKSYEATWIQRGNIGTALFFIVTLFLFNLPYVPLVMTVGLNMG